MDVNKRQIWLFGGGFKEIETKEEGLEDYRFSFAIENCCYDYYFTEKLLDCFLTGTVPIYIGCERIGDIFNSDGIIFLDDKIDIAKFNKELYESKKRSYYG
jgi:hypothetical protein